MEQKEYTGHSTGYIWKIVLVIICISILLYGFFCSENKINDPIWLLGVNLPISLLLWGVFYVIFVNKKGRNIAFISFFAIYFSIIASELIGYYQQKQKLLEAQKAVTAIYNQYSSIKNSLADSKGLSKGIDKPIDTTPKASGDYGEIEMFIKEFLNQAASQRKAYLQELENIGWNKLLDAERFKADKSLVESKVIIQKAKDAVTKYQERSIVLFNNTRENAHKLSINESLKQDIIPDFDRKMEETIKIINTMWSFEGKIVSEYDSIINLLSEKNGAWVVSGGQIVFNNNSDLDLFKSHFASIQDIANQRQQIYMKSVEKANRVINAMAPQQPKL